MEKVHGWCAVRYHDYNCVDGLAKHSLAALVGTRGYLVNSGQCGRKTYRTKRNDFVQHAFEECYASTSRR